jgi:hypothetical protein
VEFENVEAAQKALNYQGNIQIFSTPSKAETSDSEFIDPDVQSELDLMYPVGQRPTQQKQGKLTKNRKNNLMKIMNFQQSNPSFATHSLK